MKRPHILTHVLLLGGALIMAFPFFWMISTSFKPIDEALQFPPSLFPQNWTLANYTRVFEFIPLGVYYFNSITMSLGSALGVLATSSLAGYAFARMRFRGKGLLFGIILAMMMIPPEVRLIPNFVIINELNWTNTFQGLILPFAVNVFSIFLMRQAFLSIPHELYEAAVIDGASHLRYFVSIMLPLTKSSLSVVGLLAFLRSWNELIWPLLITDQENMRTLQVGLTTLTANVGTEFAVLMAATTLVVLPILGLFMVAQRQFIEGIASTGMK